MWNFLNKIGIELEGGWQSLPADRLKGDGSVGSGTDLQSRARILGEVASAPLRESEIGSFLERNYPAVVDKSCGMHVHVSTRTLLAYAVLMDRSTQDAIVADLKAWSETAPGVPSYWAERFLPGFYYCDVAKYRPETQVLGTGRYAAVNCCYAAHGTVEFRVVGSLPTVALAKACVRRLTEKIEAVLAEKLGSGEGPAAVGMVGGAVRFALVKRSGTSGIETVQDFANTGAAFNNAHRRGLAVSTVEWTANGSEHYKIERVTVGGSVNATPAISSGIRWVASAVVTASAAGR